MYLCGVTSFLYTSWIPMGALLVNIVTTIFLFHVEYGLERLLCNHFLYLCTLFTLNKTFILDLCVLKSQRNTVKCWSFLGIII